MIKEKRAREELQCAREYLWYNHKSSESLPERCVGESIHSAQTDYAHMILFVPHVWVLVWHCDCELRGMLRCIILYVTVSS